MTLMAVGLVALILAIVLLVYGSWMIHRRHYGDAVLLYILFVIALLVSKAVQANM